MKSLEINKVKEIKKELKLSLTDFQQKAIEEMKKLGYYHTGGGGYTNSMYFENSIGNDTVRISDHMKGSGYINADHHIEYNIEYETDDMGNIIESYVADYYLEKAIKEAKGYKKQIEKDLKEYEKNLTGKSKVGICNECPKNTKLYLCDNCEDEIYYCVECLQSHKNNDNCDYY